VPPSSQALLLRITGYCPDFSTLGRFLGSRENSCVAPCWSWLWQVYFGQPSVLEGAACRPNAPETAAVAGEGAARRRRQKPGSAEHRFANAEDAENRLDGLLTSSAEACFMFARHPCLSRTSSRLASLARRRLPLARCVACSVRCAAKMPSAQAPRRRLGSAAPAVAGDPAPCRTGSPARRSSRTAYGPPPPPRQAPRHRPEASPWYPAAAGRPDRG
jgi:hypothetical protein